MVASCLLASMNRKIIVTTPASMSGPLKLDCNQVKAIFLDLFNEKNDDSLWHIYKFAKRCEGLSVGEVA
jgi:hypothetical protein